VFKTTGAKRTRFFWEEPKRTGFFWKKTERTRFFLRGSFCGVLLAKPLAGQPHDQWGHIEVDATGRDRVYGWLSVGYHGSGASRPGRVGHSDPLPWAIYRLYLDPFHVQLGEWVFVLNRAVGVNPELVLSSRYGMSLVVFVPQHQAAVYETYNKK
jgi:hypothetical protein